MSSTATMRRLNIENINPHVKEAKYAVRGELAVRAESYRNQLLHQSEKPSEDAKPLPFDKIVSANIGNPQQLDQKPITFFRQVLSLLEYPALLEHEDILTQGLGFKSDALERARWLLSECHSIGAYSHSQGVPAIRKSVADFIEREPSHIPTGCVRRLTGFIQGAMATRRTLTRYTSPLVLPRESTQCCTSYGQRLRLAF